MEQTAGANPFSAFDVGTNAAPVFEDTDDDADTDLLVGNGDGLLKYFLNNGGTYEEQSGGSNPLETLDVGDHAAPTFADYDGDGHADLVAESARAHGYNSSSNLGSSSVCKRFLGTFV